jgi:hypothetical protein
MCDPFFYEFRVVPSVNVFKLVFCTANIHKPQTRKARFDPDQRHNTMKTIVHTVYRDKRPVSA